MRIHLRYLIYVVRHKWFVLLECWKLGILWQGIIHDLSKFRPDEWFPYAEYFYGPKKPKLMETHGEGRQVALNTGYFHEKDEAEFDKAWLLHQHRSPHHWQFWLLRKDKPTSDWAIWAHQPEIGPYYLAHDNKQVAIVEVIGKNGLPENTSREAFLSMREMERALVQASVKVLEMPDCYRKEMLADWRGAGRAVGKPYTAAWYKANKANMMLGPETRFWIEGQLGVQEYESGYYGPEICRTGIVK